MNALPPRAAGHAATPRPQAPAEEWDGSTYYGRQQLKPAPFNNYVVGGYIFLAGLCGGATLLAGAAELTHTPQRENLVRRARYLSLLAPFLGGAMLIWDLHTPKRFYMMLRIFKPTSPMSIGTYIFSAFSALAIPVAALQFAADRFAWARAGWLRRANAIASVPLAASGAGIGTYTAALLAATSTPLWAAAPRALAMRFAASSVASGAAMLSIGESGAANRRRLDEITLAALTLELGATAASHAVYQRRGVGEALKTTPGIIEAIGATGLGVVAPLALQATSLLLTRGRSRPLSRVAAALTMAGSLVLRISFMAAGNQSALRPTISYKFSQPRNL